MPSTPDPTEGLLDILSGVIGNVGNELMDAWKRGVLDGIEISAKCVAQVRDCPEWAEYGPLFEGLATCLRETGLRMQLDSSPLIEGI